MTHKYVDIIYRCSVQTNHPLLQQEQGIVPFQCRSLTVVCAAREEAVGSAPPSPLGSKGQIYIYECALIIWTDETISSKAKTTTVRHRWYSANVC